MAAGPAIEMWSRERARPESSDGKARVYSRERAFTVTLAADDPLEETYNAAGLPLVFDLFPGSSHVVCRNLDVQRVSPIMALVVAQYRGEIGQDGLESSPIDNPVIVTWRNVTTDEPIDEDWDGNPIVTANNEPIDGLTERVPDQQATIERNFLAVDIYAVSAYLRSSNSDTFLGWPPGTCRMMEYSATRIYNTTDPGFWKVSATFQFRIPYRTTADKAWYKRVRHEGFLVRDAAGEEPHHAWDAKTKTTASRPVLLKEDGTIEPDPENAHFLEFKTLDSLPYNALGLLT